VGLVVGVAFGWRRATNPRGKDSRGMETPPIREGGESESLGGVKVLWRYRLLERVTRSVCVAAVS